MGYFNSKLAREVGRLTGWKQKIFGRRYQAIVVSDEEGAQIERLRYGLAHGVKEDLVDRPRDWPGVHGVQALLEGEDPGRPLVRPHPGVRRPPPWGGLQPSPVRHPGDPDSRPASLLEASDRGAATEACGGPGGGHRSRSRRSQEEDRRQAPGPGRHPGPRPPPPAREVPRSLPPRPSTRPAKPCAVGSARPTPCSWPPTAKPPRSSGPGSATCAFRPEVSRQGCRSWAGKPSARVLDLTTGRELVLGRGW